MALDGWEECSGTNLGLGEWGSARCMYGTSLYSDGTRRYSTKMHVSLCAGEAADNCTRFFQNLSELFPSD
jgi:hypothetical protein